MDFSTPCHRVVVITGDTPRTSMVGGRLFVSCVSESKYSKCGHYNSIPFSPLLLADNLLFNTVTTTAATALFVKSWVKISFCKRGLSIIGLSRSFWGLNLQWPSLRFAQIPNVYILILGSPKCAVHKENEKKSKMFKLARRIFSIYLHF